MTNEELFHKNRQAVKKYILWRNELNREEAEEQEEPEEINEYRLEINSLTCK